METILQILVDGISLGSLYALLALGLAMVFGIMNLINFAHGEFITLGGYTMLFLMAMAVPVIGVILVATIVVVIIALGMERIAFRPVRQADATTMLITSFAVSFLIKSVLILTIGTLPRALKLPVNLLVPFSILGFNIAKLNVITIGVTLLLFAALLTLLNRSLLGIQMRAAAEDFSTARLMGIKANRVIATAFAISGMLAGIVSILWFWQLGIVTPTVGVEPTIFAFTAIVIGGMGSLPGAALGGFLVGFTTIALQAFLPYDIRVYRQAILFVIVIIFLLTKPSGLIPLKTTGRRV